MRKIVMIMVVALVMVFSTTAFGESLPKDPPIGLENMGTVDAVDRRAQKIVINDSAFRLAKYVVVHGTNNRSISIHRLRGGERIRFATSFDDKSGDSVITEIWLLPAAN